MSDTPDARKVAEEARRKAHVNAGCCDSTGQLRRSVSGTAHVPLHNQIDRAIAARAVEVAEEMVYKLDGLKSGWVRQEAMAIAEETRDRLRRTLADTENPDAR